MALRNTSLVCYVCGCVEFEPVPRHSAWAVWMPGSLGGSRKQSPWMLSCKGPFSRSVLQEWDCSHSSLEKLTKPIEPKDAWEPLRKYLSLSLQTGWKHALLAWLATAAATEPLWVFSIGHSPAFSLRLASPGSWFSYQFSGLIVLWPSYASAFSEASKRTPRLTMAGQSVDLTRRFWCRF